MNIKNRMQFGLSILFVTSFLFITTNTVAAAGKENYIGQVSKTTTNNIPYLSLRHDGIRPSKVHQVPGGGNAIVSASLGWAAARMDGMADTSLSSGVFGTFSLCATAVQVYKNSVQKGGAGQVCGARTGGGSISSIRSVYEYVYGSTWRLDTAHAVTAPGYSWYPSQTISATP